MGTAFQGLHTGFKYCQKDAIKIANQLCYNRKYIDRLNKAKSIEEINQIMHTARKEEN